MSLKQILNHRNIVNCAASTKVSEVGKLMKSQDVGAVVITDKKGRPSGIVTDRDLVLRCFCKDEPSLDVAVEEIMSTPVETVSEDAGIYDAIKHMQDKEVRRICVVDSEGVCSKVVSFGDILELLAREMSLLVAPNTKTPRKAA